MNDWREWFDWTLSIYAAFVATWVVIKGPEWLRAYVLATVGTFALVLACVLGVMAVMAHT